MDSISCLLHPHHTPVYDHQRSLRSILLGLNEDPYYSIDGRSHHNLVAPKFNVRETPTAYVLEGEVPGVSEKQSLAVEWVAGRTLIVRGTIPAHDIAAEWGVKADTPAEETAADDEHEPAKSAKKEKKSERRWLSERHTGEFQRSFTFSSEVDPKGMKAKLDAGLLGIMVPKKTGGEATHVVQVE